MQCSQWVPKLVGEFYTVFVVDQQDEPNTDVNELCSTVRERKTPCGFFRCLPSDHLSSNLLPCDTFTYLYLRPPNEFIPPVQEPYQYIIFRASEVKDLAVDETPPVARRSVHDDPAVLGVSPGFRLPILSFL